MIRPPKGRGQHDLASRSRHRGSPERQCGLASVIPGTSSQDDLRRAHHDRAASTISEIAIDPFPACERTADAGDDEHDVDEQAEDDRRHAGHHVDEVARSGCWTQHRRPAVFGECTARRQDPDRDRDHRLARADQDLQRADDRVRDPDHHPERRRNCRSTDSGSMKKLLDRQLPSPLSTTGQYDDQHQRE